jgi:glyoxylase-like metal-dependent hydrolase (beta-lactamase superfamily II)
MLVKITRDLYKIRNSFGSNIYLIAGKRPCMVDAGFPVDLPMILLGLKALSIKPGDLELIMATHYHGDHVGTVAGLRERHGVRVAMHEMDRPYATGDLPQHTCEAGTLQLAFYTALWPLFRYRHFDVDITLKEADAIDILGGLNVIHTPGHSEGSICLLDERNGILFSGDLIRNEKGILEGPPPHFTPDPEAAYLSLLKVAGLDFDTLLSGHGEVILKGAGDRFRTSLKEGKIWPLSEKG